MKKLFHILFFGSILSSGMFAQTLEVDVEATKDNSVFSEGNLSNGAGDFIFTGVIKTGHKRRALVKFDLSSAVPEGVTVDSAKLVLVPSKVKTDGTGVALHRLNTDWGEGTSNAAGAEGQGSDATEGDATWTYAINGEALWIKPGGDYRMASTASAIVNLGSDAIFEGPVLTDDVNTWLAAPSENHGWIVVGDESTSLTAIRFASRENDNEASRPTLKLFYTQGPTSTLPAETKKNGIRVYQGHGLGELVIGTNSLAGKSRFEVYSISGNLVHSVEINLNGGETRINTGIEKSGIYVFRIISSETMQSGKILVRGQ